MFSLVGVALHWKKLAILFTHLISFIMKHKIVVQDYYQECGDGCCVEYGHLWFVDGNHIHSSPCQDSGWLAVLNHLGIEAEVIGKNEIGEEVWSL